MPMPRTSSGVRSSFAEQRGEALVDHAEHLLGAVGDVHVERHLGERRTGEIADRQPRVRGAEVGDEHDAGALVEGRAASAGGRRSRRCRRPRRRARGRAARPRAARRSSAPGRCCGRGRRASSPSPSRISCSTDPAPISGAVLSFWTATARKRSATNRQKLEVASVTVRTNFCLTNDAKVRIRSAAHGRPPLRVAIAGTGFIGAVHARSARLAGARIVGVSASSPARAEQAAGALRRRARLRAAPRRWSRAADVDVVHICTPNHLHLPLAEAALAAGKHVICEKPLALDVAGAQRLVDAAAAAGRVAAVPFVYRYYPTVREARERVRTRRHRARSGCPRHLPAGLAAAPEDDNWRVDADARRRLARLRRHRLALVRPRRVRHRPPHHPAQRPHAHRAARAPHAEHARRLRPRQRRRREARGRHRGRRGHAVRDRRRRGRHARSSARSRPGRKNRLWLEVDGARGGRHLLPGGARDAVGRPRARRDADPRDSPST